jgi:type II secretion system protein H
MDSTQQQVVSSQNARQCARAHGFTLVELLLVMGMLVVVLAVAFPSLTGFFRGRSLDAEAHRFLALTRYAQSRAVSEGIPMLMWIDVEGGMYGLEAPASYLEKDDKAVEYELNKDIEVEVEQSLSLAASTEIRLTLPGLGNSPMIRFEPDGSISDSSPEGIVFRQGEDTPIWIGKNLNRLNYEIQSEEPSGYTR